MTPVSQSPRVLLNIARPWDESGPVQIAHLAAGAGLDGVGLADSPALFPDPLIATERVLTGTTLGMAGPCVLSLGLRGPDSVAGALRTLTTRHGDRVACFVGRGESSVRNAGLPVPSLKAHLAALGRVSLLLGEAGLSTPLIGAASGPRTIAATSAVLPGVLLDVGTDPDTVTRAVTIARGANRDVQPWLFLRAAVADTEEQMASAAAPVLGSCATRLATSPDFYGLTSEQRDVAEQVAAAHDYRRHGTPDALSSTDLPPGAETLVRRRFLAAGPASDITATVGALAHLDLAGVVIAGALDGVLARLPELTAAVRAGLRLASAAHEQPLPGGAHDWS